MSDTGWLILMVAAVQTLFGGYIGYTIGDHHGWKRGYHWNDEVEVANAQTESDG